MLNFAPAKLLNRLFSNARPAQRYLAFSATRELIGALQNRTAPLLLKLDEAGFIIAAHYSYESAHDMGIVFRHPEGAIDIGVDAKAGFDAEVWAEGVDPDLSDWLPGLAILERLDKDTAAQIGLEFVDAAGPAGGSVPMVRFTGCRDELDRALETEKLPFRMQFGKK